MRLEGKTALITGAAGGLGSTIARGFINEGANVVLTDLPDSNVEEAVSALGSRARFAALDVTDDKSWASVMDGIERLDVLVNNAGITSLGTIEEVSVEQYEQIFGVDVLGVLLGCKFAIEKMKSTGSGSIINISSSTSVSIEPQMATYCSAKAAVNNITKTAALHCCEQGYGIRVNVILPGLVQTAMLDDALAQVPPEQRETMLASWKAKMPIGRLGRLKEIVSAALYLASEAESGFTTGLEMLVDGGAGI